MGTVLDPFRASRSVSAEKPWATVIDIPDLVVNAELGTFCTRI